MANLSALAKESVFTASVQTILEYNRQFDLRPGGQSFRHEGAGDQWQQPLITGFPQSAILAICTSNPVFGSSEVSANTLNPSPLTSVWR